MLRKPFRRRARARREPTVRRVAAALGAVVEGIDLHSLSERDIGFLRSALDEHQVLVVPGQLSVSEDRQLEIAALFGEPGGHEPFRSLGPLPDRWSKETDARYGISSSVILQERTPEIASSTHRWHTDMTFAPRPPVVGTLYPLVLPSVGGDTAWVSLYRIYESLSPPMRELCERLNGLHTLEPMREHWIETRGADFAELTRNAFPPQLHPLVVTHPRTGRKLLYLGGVRDTWMAGLVGLNPEEADMLLDYLRRQLDNIEFQFRWHWSYGDFVIWDEQSTNHKGLADHYEIDPNRLLRTVWAYPLDPA